MVGSLGAGDKFRCDSEWDCRLSRRQELVRLDMGRFCFSFGFNLFPICDVTGNTDTGIGGIVALKAIVFAPWSGISSFSVTAFADVDIVLFSQAFQRSPSPFFHPHCQLNGFVRF
jgi:hypothetical protein